MSRPAGASPEASVVIPSYNHAAFVEEAVRSVLDQEGVELELIVVDDGSTDGSPALLEPFREDPRVRLYGQANQGAHAALGRCLSLARGEVIFILDSDDAYEPGRLRRLLSLFRDDPELALAATWVRVVDAEGKELGIKRGWANMPPWPRPDAGPGLEETGDPELALLATNYVATTSNFAFRRTLVEGGLAFRPLRYCHDWDFLLEAAARGRLALVEEPLLCYRVHGANTIAEGGNELGAGRMRFEILWVVARHAARVLARRTGSLGDLEARAWASMPRFGREDILAQLLALRGQGEEPPPAYEELLDPGHPFREAAVRSLANA